MKVENDKSPRKLKESEFLEPFMEYLEPACINIKPGKDLVIYRTQDEIPVDEYGQMPRAKRNSLANSINRKLSKEEVEALSDKQREKFIGEWGLSCNISEEAARQSFLYTYKSKEERGASKEDLESYVHERGRYICRYIITEETGLITPFDKKGHANLYLYEGVNLENYRDKVYNFKTIEYKSKDEDEQ